MSSQIGQTWARQLRLAFNGTKGNAILSSFAALLIDKAIDWGTAAVTMRFPLQADGTPTDPAALAMLAHERQLEQGPAETDADFAARLEDFSAQWALAGTPLGMLVQLHYAGLGGGVLIQQNGLAHHVDTPSLADIDPAAIKSGPPSWYHRDVLPNANPHIPASTDGRPAIAANTIPWAAFAADPMDADGNQYNSRFLLLYPSAPHPDFTDSATLDRARRIIARWKPGEASCFAIVVVSAGAVWDWPVRLWDNGEIWDDPAATINVYSA